MDPTVNTSSVNVLRTVLMTIANRTIKQLLLYDKLKFLDNHMLTFGNFFVRSKKQFGDVTLSFCNRRFIYFSDLLFSLVICYQLFSSNLLISDIFLKKCHIHAFQ